MSISDPINRLINELMKLPSIGPKSAQRLTYHIIATPAAEVEKLAMSLMDVKKNIRQCSICNNLTDSPICPICSDEKRKDGRICVVARAGDIPPIERTGVFKGRYHVLGGVISPMDGIGPDHLNIRSLLSRISEEGISEIIVATNSDTSGEVTALYLSKILIPLGVSVTRLAYGLPMGATLEYADELTLSRAFEGRREMSEK